MLLNGRMPASRTWPCRWWTCGMLPPRTSPRWGRPRAAGQRILVASQRPHPAAGGGRAAAHHVPGDPAGRPVHVPSGLIRAAAGDRRPGVILP
ncbi:hypothetical protein QJS66_11215 [Kocuria rhizophila]|nr:hypothetical protein QJS66_11215 [Kocuria rhizophila]